VRKSLTSASKRRGSIAGPKVGSCDQKIRSHHIASRQRSNSPQIRVLLVDDCGDFTSAMSYFLSMKGYAVETAANGSEALARISSFGPDAIVTDVRMPGIDGLTLLHTLRESGNDVPVVILTGYQTTELIVRSNELGASCLQKPCDPTIIQSAIERAIANESR
jgi:DNA-binding response OmpR family regulator